MEGSVEGVPTMAWGILVFFALPGRPQTVAEEGTWLFSSKAERDLIRERTLAGKTPTPQHVETQHTDQAKLRTPCTRNSYLARYPLLFVISSPGSTPGLLVHLVSVWQHSDCSCRPSSKNSASHLVSVVFVARI